MGLAKAGNDILIVADYGNNRVKVVNSIGTVTNLYGVSSTSGTPARAATPAGGMAPSSCRTWRAMSKRGGPTVCSSPQTAPSMSLKTITI